MLGALLKIWTVYAACLHRYRYTTSAGKRYNYDTKLPKRGIIGKKIDEHVNVNAKTQFANRNHAISEKKRLRKVYGLCSSCSHGYGQKRVPSRNVTQSKAARVVDELNRIQKDPDAYYL